MPADASSEWHEDEVVMIQDRDRERADSDLKGDQRSDVSADERRRREPADADLEHVPASDAESEIPLPNAPATGEQSGARLAQARAAIDSAFAEPAELPEPSDSPAERVEQSRLAQAIEKSEAHHVASLDEAEAYARDMGIESADYTGFDQESANEVNAALESLMDRYPDIRGIRNVSTIQSRNDRIRDADPRAVIDDSTTMAATVQNSEHPELNGIVVQDWRAANHNANAADLHDQVEKGWHPEHTDSTAGVVAHEFGHVVDSALKNIRPDIYEQEVQPVLDKYEGRGREWLETNVSGYAAGSPGDSVPTAELLAEAFAEYHLSPAPREAAAELGTAIDRAYRRAYSW